MWRCQVNAESIPLSCPPCLGPVLGNVNDLELVDYCRANGVGATPQDTRLWRMRRGIPPYGQRRNCRAKCTHRIQVGGVFDCRANDPGVDAWLAVQALDVRALPLPSADGCPAYAERT